MECFILRCIDDVSSGAVNDFEARNKAIVGLSTPCMMALAVPKPTLKNLVINNLRAELAEQVALGTLTRVL
jgi:hypothetical protein